MVEDMYVFECVEAFITLQLIDVTVCINIEFVFAKHRNGICRIEGEFVQAAARFDLNTVAVKRETGVFM